MSLLKASPQVHLDLKYFHKMFSWFFYREKGADFAFALYTAVEIGHTYEDINLITKLSVNVSQLHIVRKKKKCALRWYALKLLKFCQFFEILSYRWVAFF